MPASGLASLCLALAFVPPWLDDLRSDAAAVRLLAVQRVERLGADGTPDAAYLPALANLLNDADEQTRGLAALALTRHVGERVPPGVVLPLVLALHDTNPHVRAFCGRSLAQLGEQALPEVTALLRPGTARVVRSAAVEACVQLARHPAARRAADALLWHALADHELREQAFRALRRVRHEQDMPPQRDGGALLAALRADELRCRSLAVVHLAALGREAVPLLVAFSEEPDVRDDVARVLERLLSAGVVPTAAQARTFLTHLGGDLGELGHALGRLAWDGAPTPTQPLPRPRTRVDSLLVAAIEAGPFGDLEAIHRQLGAATLPEVEDNLVARDPRMQAAAADALRYLHLQSGRPLSDRALRHLGVALRSERLATAQEAALALLTVLRPEQAIPDDLAVALSNALRRDDALLRLTCARVLAVCGPQVQATLVELLDARELAVRDHAAEAIARLREPRRIATSGIRARLESQLDSPYPPLRASARRALNALESVPPPFTVAPAPRDRNPRQLLPELRAVDLRPGAVRLAAASKPTGALLVPLAKLLRAQDGVTRELAALALAHELVRSRAHLPVGIGFALAVGLDDNAPAVRTACRSALAALGEAALPQWQALLAPDLPRQERVARLLLVVSLWEIRELHPSLRDFLWDSVTDRDVVLRDRARTLLLTGTSARALGVPDPARLGAALRMGDPDLVKAASAHLGALGAAAVPTLLELFDDPNPHARTAAADLLTKQLRGALAAESLLRLVQLLARRDPVEFPGLTREVLALTRTRWSRERLFDALAPRLTGTIPDEPLSPDPTLRFALGLVPASFAGLHALQPEVRQRALERLDRCGPVIIDTALLPALAASLGPYDPNREVAARLLARHQGGHAVPEVVFLALLLAQNAPDEKFAVTCQEVVRQLAEAPLSLADLGAHRDARVRTAALLVQLGRALGERPSVARAVELLGALLTGPDVDAARAAALLLPHALPATVTSDVLLGLRLGVRSSDANLRRACVEALAACGAQAETSLCDLLDNEAPAVRRAAAEAVCRMVERTRYRPGWTADSLRQQARDQDAEVAQAARRALAALGVKP